MLNAGARDADGIDFLKRIQANGMGRDLPADDDQRDRIHIGGGDTRDGVSYAGAGSYQRHSHLVTGAGVAIRCVHRRLLVPHQDMLDLILLEQLVVNKQHGATRIAKNIIHPFFLQTTYRNFSAC